MFLQKISLKKKFITNIYEMKNYLKKKIDSGKSKKNILAKNLYLVMLSNFNDLFLKFLKCTTFIFKSIICFSSIILD